MQKCLTTADEPVMQAARILHDEIAAASAELGDSKPGSAANVHGARKQLKRARATLRLLRDALGDDTYGRENTALRDAARPLSFVRDSEILLEALDGVVKRFGDAATCPSLDKLRMALQEHRSTVHETGVGRARLTEIQKTLTQVLQPARRRQFDEVGWPTLSKGLRRVYRKGRAALKEARCEPTTEALHEWRKQTKYLWHQLQVLEPLSSDVLGELADEFHSLSDYLGDDHDLAVLRAKVFATRGDPDDRSTATLKELIDRRRTELQGRAFALGERLYADKPKLVAQRLDEYWAEWAREAPASAPVR